MTQSSALHLTRAGLVLQNLRVRPWGRGSRRPPPLPRLAWLLGVVARNGKYVLILVKNYFAITAINLPLRSILRLPKVIQGQI